MNYIVYDTEFSQPQPRLFNPNARFIPNPVSPFEVIEIGAVKVNEELHITGSFDRLIKPVIYKKLSPIVVKKTGIRSIDLEGGDSFGQVMADFREFCGDDFILCSWSSNDVKILKMNCIFHKLECPWIDQFYDIQVHCTRLLGFPKNQTVGLKNALNALDIEIEGKLHRALEDALYTAKVFIKVYSEEMRKDIRRSLHDFRP